LFWGTNTAQQKWVFRTNNDYIRVEVNGGNVVGSTNIRDDKWHHVAATWSDDGTPDVEDVKLYVDGVLDAKSGTTTEPINTVSGTDVTVGVKEGNGSDFDGLIDDVRVYDRVLTPEEIGRLASMLDAGLVGHWKLDDGTDSPTAADSAGSNDGVLGAAMDPATDWITNGPVDGALAFAGTAESVDCGTGLDITGTLTVAAWVKIDDTGQNWEIVDKKAGPTVANGYTLEASCLDGMVRIRAGDSTVGEGAVAWDAARWHHVAGVVDGTTARVYFDGVEVGSGAVTALGSDIATALRLGQVAGMLDDVRVYDRALLPVEIQTLFNQGDPMWMPFIVSVTAAGSDPGLTDGDTLTIVFDVDTNEPGVATKADIDGLINFDPASLGRTLGESYTGAWTAPDTLVITVLNAAGGSLDVGHTIRFIADGTQDLKNAAGTSTASTEAAVVVGSWGVLSDPNLVAWYLLDEPGGATQALDATANAHHSTAVNGALPGYTGKIDGAWYFDGNNRRITLPAGISTPIVDNITLAAWVWADAPANQGGMAAVLSERFAGDGDVEFTLYTASGKLAAGFYDGAWHQYAEATDIPTGVWVHVAATYDGHFVRVYRDGAEVTASGDLNLPLPSGTNGWDIGHRHDGSDDWRGRIDDVRIYNRTLTPQEIYVLAGGIGYEYGLTAHWELDETVGITASDSTSNNNTGVLQGMTGTEWTTGQVEGALELNGTDDYVQIAAGGSSTGFLHDAFTERTVAMWFNADDTAGTRMLFDEGGASNGFGIRIMAGQLELGAAGSSATATTATAFADTGSWHHVVGV
ncbi:MAG: LamG domain-containing protein, partial [Planctomycetota bacterium]